MTDITGILNRLESGDAQAANELLPLVYEELRKLAAAKLLHEKPEQTLDATALVHEAYLRLLPNERRGSADEPHWDGRGHFFAAAAEAMRRILIDRARRKRSPKHGGDRQRVELSSELAAAPVLDENLLALDEALTRFAQRDPIKARLVELRYFAGLSGRQAAEILGISTSTADRYWVFARAWLRREMEAGRLEENNSTTC